MPTELVTIDFRKAFPVFPLQDSVLLPQAILPLHVFEARYRRMVNDALDSSGIIAVGLFEGGVDPQDYESGNFSLLPYVGVGQIRDYQRLTDGRFIVILQGLCRARIVKELTRSPYRRFQLAPAEADVPEETRLEVYRHRIEELMLRQNVREGAAELPDIQVHDHDLSMSVVVDLAIAALCHDTPQRYRMLSQPDVCMRAEWLIRQMEARLSSGPDGNRRN